MKKFINIALILSICLLISTTAYAQGNDVQIKYRAHSADIGWIDPMSDLGSTNQVGTTGQAKQLEAVEFRTESLPAGMGFQARAHVANVGWQNWITNNGQIGTTGQGLGIEAVELKFTNSQTPAYDIYYRAHVCNIGWLGWAKNGETAGTSGFALPVECIETRIVPAGSPAPGDTSNHSYSLDDINNMGFELTLNVNGGGTAQGSNGYNAGDPAVNASYDGLAARLSNPNYAGSSIAYQAFCSNVGWCGWNQDGGFSGNGGNPIEAVQFEIHGDLANTFDIYYQVSVSKYGWLDWTKNGQYAGTMSGGLPINSVKVKLVPKAVLATPGLTYRPFFEVPCNQTFAGRGIMVSIPLQMVFVKDSNNQIIFISDCCTGTPNSENQTPTGNFQIIKKSRDTYLRGADYYDHVDYWIPFIGTVYGFHDASWRTPDQFGRDVYTYHGSHGCINMRLNDIAVFNRLIAPGDLVVIR